MLDGAPEGATNRLYKNNRDGTFTDVTEKAGLHRTGWASAVAVGDYNNDGFDDLFVTYWGQNVLYRNNGDGTFTDVTEKAGLLHPGRALGFRLHLRRLRPRRPPGSVRGELPRIRSEARAASPARMRNCNWKGIPVNCGPRGLPPGIPAALPQQRRRHFHRRQRSSGVGQGERQLLHDHRCRPISTTTAGRISTSPATPRPVSCCETITTALSPTLASRAAWR